MPSTYQSIVVNAPVDEVWQRLRNFHDFSWAPEVITACEQVGEVGGTEVGAKRILNGAFHETLVSLDDNARRLVYSIDDGPNPVSPADVRDYLGTIHALPVTEGNATFVEWSSEWKSDSEEAVEFCGGIYKALLQALAGAF